jgi:outer membrane lipoprotein carrier protein LolA
VRRQIGLAAVLLVRTVAAASAACNNTDACLRVIEESQRSTRVLAARFEQTKHLSLMADPLVSRGRFGFKQPDQVLWQIDEPPITVHIDAQGVHLPEVPNAAAEVAALAPFGRMMRELAGVFTGSLQAVRRSFDVRATGDDAGVRVQLAPRNPEWQRMFRAVDLTFAGPSLTLQAIHLDEALGDSLDIVFSDVHRNDDTANAAFAH